MEYLVVMTTRVPDGTSEEAIDDIRTREDAHSRELASQGHLLRLWRPPLQPGEWRSLGLFAADDGDALERVLASMPLRVWRTDEVTPLSRHPNDPALAASPGATEFLTTFTVTIPEGTPAQTVEDTKAREAERAFASGACGLQLHTNINGAPLDDERFFPVFEVAAICGRANPASAIRAGSCAISASRSALSMRCQRAISGSVRPQPKQRLVLGSIIQTAIHGVSMLIFG